MQFDGVSRGGTRSLGQLFRSDPSTVEFLKPQMGEKDWVSKTATQKMAPKTKQKHLNFKSSVQNDLEQRDSVMSGQECWVQMRGFLFPFGILLLDEDLMIFQGSWIPAGKKVQTTSQPRLSVHHLGGPVSYTITINLYIFLCHQHAILFTNIFLGYPQLP